jgi:glutaredoxin
MSIKPIPNIQLYGTSGCRKTKYYQLVLDDIGLPYDFLDVERSNKHAKELRGLYETRRLNFPTITIGEKKMRNPYKEDLVKWINKLIPTR